MQFRILNKEITVFALVLLIIVGGVFLVQEYQFGNKYLRPLKLFLLAKLNSLEAIFSPKVPKTELFETSEFGTSEINIDNLLPEEKEESLGEEEGEKGGEEMAETPTSQMNLIEIKTKLDEIRKKTKQVDQEIKKLKSLIRVKKEIDNISQQVKKIDQQIKELKAEALEKI